MARKQSLALLFLIAPCFATMNVAREFVRKHVGDAAASKLPPTIKTMEDFAKTYHTYEMLRPELHKTFEPNTWGELTMEEFVKLHEALSIELNKVNTKDEMMIFIQGVGLTKGEGEYWAHDYRVTTLVLLAMAMDNKWSDINSMLTDNEKKRLREAMALNKTLQENIKKHIIEVEERKQEAVRLYNEERAKPKTRTVYSGGGWGGKLTPTTLRGGIDYCSCGEERYKCHCGYARK